MTRYYPPGAAPTTDDTDLTGADVEKRTGPPTRRRGEARKPLSPAGERRFPPAENERAVDADPKFDRRKDKEKTT